MLSFFELLLIFRPTADALDKVGTYSFAFMFLAVWILAAAGREKIKRPKSIRLIEGFLLAFIAAITLSAIYNQTGFAIILKYFVLLCVIDTACLLASRHKISLESVQKAVLLSCLIPLAIGLYQMASGTGAFDNEVGARRINSTFIVPSQYSIYLMIVGAVAFNEAMKRKGKSALPFWGLFVLIVVELVASYTRIAWFGLALIIGILVIKALLKGEMTVGAFFGVLVAIACLMLLFWDVISARLFSSTAGNSMNTRRYIWDVMLNLIPQSPLLGFGPDSTVNYAGLRAHNEYLKTLFEYGFFGAVAFWLLQLVSIVELAKASKISKGCFFSFVIAVCLLVVSYTDNIYDSLVFQLYIWALASVSLTCSSEKRLEEDSRLTDENSSLKRGA